MYYVKCKLVGKKTFMENDMHIKLEDSIGENLDDLGIGDDFLDTIPKAQFMEEIVDKLDLVKMRNSDSVKHNIKKIKRQATD